MRILWIHFGLIDEERLTSTSASARYRCLIPSQELRRKDIDVAFAKAQDVAPETLMPVYRPDVVLFTKLSSNDPDEVMSTGARALALAAAAHMGGACVISDHCDNRIDHPLLGSYYKNLIDLCQGVVASTPDLARIITLRTGKVVHVVSDPVEGAQQPVRFTPPQTWDRPPRFLRWIAHQCTSQAAASRPLELLWFGHQSNFEAVIDSWPALQKLSSATPLVLHVLTTATSYVTHFCDRRSQSSGTRASIQLTPWTDDALWAALHNCDIVFLPCDQDPNKVLAKSPNRLAEALWAGRFAVAHPIPAYEAFTNWAWIAQDIASGIRWAIRHPEAVVSRVHAAQSYIASVHSPVRIAEQWLALIHEFRRG